MNTPSGVALPLSSSFRRVLQLLAAGMLLVGSSGLVDPCEPGVRLHHEMQFEDQDRICSTAQTLLRMLLHGGHKVVLGLVDDGCELRSLPAGVLSVCLFSTFANTKVLQ